jgi:leucyl-tRNA synthetase
LVKVDEPFTKLLCQGMVLNHIFSRRTESGAKEYHWPHDVDFVHDAAGKVTGAQLKHAVGDLPSGTPITYEGVGTMSKSKNNGVDPQAIIDQYGADTARLYTMFTAPPEATLEWNDSAVEGGYRFLKRVYAFATKFAANNTNSTVGGSEKGLKFAVSGCSKAAQSLRREVHSVLKQVDYDYSRMQYNTVVSGTMKLLNALEGLKDAASEADRAVLAEGLSVLLRVLYPVCPHICAHLWVELGFDAKAGSLLDAPWPQVDAAALVQQEIELMLQVNGKLRGSVTVSADADTAAIEAAAVACEAFTKAANGAAPKKVIVVPGRLVNVVV